MSDESYRGEIKKAFCVSLSATNTHNDTHAISIHTHTHTHTTLKIVKLREAAEFAKVISKYMFHCFTSQLVTNSMDHSMGKRGFFLAILLPRCP